MYISPNDQQGFIYTHPFFPHHIILKQIPDIISLWKGFTPQCDMVIAVLRSVFFKLQCARNYLESLLKRFWIHPQRFSGSGLGSGNVCFI